MVGNERPPSDGVIHMYGHDVAGQQREMPSKVNYLIERLKWQVEYKFTECSPPGGPVGLVQVLRTPAKGRK